MAKVSTQQAIKNLAVAKRLIGEASTPAQVRTLYSDWLSRVAGSNARKDQLLAARESKITSLQTAQAAASQRAMASARGNNTAQARGGMLALMRQAQERGRVSGPAARGNYAKTGRSG